MAYNDTEFDRLMNQNTACTVCRHDLSEVMMKWDDVCDGMENCGVPMPAELENFRPQLSKLINVFSHRIYDVRVKLLALLPEDETTQGPGTASEPIPEAAVATPQEERGTEEDGQDGEHSIPEENVPEEIQFSQKAIPENEDVEEKDLNTQ